MKHHLLSAFLLAWTMGCATQSARPPRLASDAQARPALVLQPPVPERDDGMTMTGELGQVSEDHIEAQFKTHLPDINRCYQEVLARRWYLSGKVELKVRIAADGAVRSTSVTHSSLGNYEVERCVATVAQKLRFLAPKGGEAEFTYPVEFPVRAQVASWPEERVAPHIMRHKRDLSACRPAQKRAPSSLRLTLYIGPGGRVASAGLAAAEPIDERLGACLVARVAGWRFEDPLGQLVKATYAIN